MIKTAKDLRHAKYNPRTITKQQQQNLQLSLEATGDLSGLVFNRRTKTLVAGHQRTAALAQWPSKAELKPFTDAFGTVQVGFMVYKTDTGIIKVPMRIVDWDLKREKQANIAANMHGGDFDKQKLATLVAELETDKKFSLELLGMDAHDLAMLHKLLPDNVLEVSEADYEEAESEFPSLREKLEASKSEMICCPKCKFKFKP